MPVIPLSKLSHLPRYRNPNFLLNPPSRPLKLQNSLIEAKEPTGQNAYITTTHEALMHKTSQWRNKFGSTKGQTARRAMATQQINEWVQYMDGLRIEARQTIPTETLPHLYSCMLSTKQRREQRISLKNIQAMFALYSRTTRFVIPFHPNFLMKIIHPHYGYLNEWDVTQKLDWEQIQVFLQWGIAISKMMEAGWWLHAAELESLMFWRLQFGGIGRLEGTTSGTQGAIAEKTGASYSEEKRQVNHQAALPTVTSFLNFLPFFKFNRMESSEQLASAFSHSLKKLPNQLDKSTDLVRFELWRTIYLDRGL